MSLGIKSFEVLACLFFFMNCRPTSGSKPSFFQKSPPKIDYTLNFKESNKRFKRIKSYSFLRSDSAELPEVPWPGYYWASIEGGLAYAWRRKENNLDNIRFPTLTELQFMTQAERDNLSPAHKFDIYNNDLTYPTVKLELSRTRNHKQSWEGLCHGWAPASLVYRQPKDVKTQGTNKIPLTFFSSDTKSLLSFNEAVLNRNQFRPSFAGSRCESLEDLAKNEQLPENCFPNAASFHLALVNSIKRLKKGFVVNTIPNVEVWNFPVYRYEYSSKPGEA